MTHPAARGPIDGAVLEQLDTAMVAERHAARLAGPEAWRERLRTAAIEHLMATESLGRAIAEVELAEYLATFPVTEQITALEQLVFLQRLMTTTGDDAAVRAAMPTVFAEELPDA